MPGHYTPGGLALNGITSLAVLPNGRLASGGYDGDVKQWLVNEEELIATLCLRVGHNMTKTEWDRYIRADTPQQESCKAFGVRSNWRTPLEHESGALSLNNGAGEPKSTSGAPQTSSAAPASENASRPVLPVSADQAADIAIPDDVGTNNPDKADNGPVPPPSENPVGGGKPEVGTANAGQSSAAQAATQSTSQTADAAPPVQEVLPAPQPPSGEPAGRGESEVEAPNPPSHEPQVVPHMAQHGYLTGKTANALNRQELAHLAAGRKDDVILGFFRSNFH
jgi:hypothetical protein